MRVWLAPSAFWPQRGGVEELTWQLGRGLSVRGYEVQVLVNRYPDSLPSHDSVDDLAVRRLRFTAPRANVAAVARFVGSQVGLQQSLDRIRPIPDLIHIQCLSVQVSALIAYARRHRVPVIVTTQGEVAMDEHALYQRSSYMRFVFRVASREAAALTACSAWSLEESRRYAPRFARATIIANGVDPTQWRVAPRTDAPVLCAWGRHVPQKGFDLAIAAFSVLKRRIPEARMLIGGEGKETTRLKTLAGEGVEFVGALDRSGVRSLLECSRVAVVPSRIEPFGIVVLEALAAGRGLVYARDTGAAEAAGDLGRPVNVYDADAFARALECELASPTDADAGRARALAFDWEHICDQYLRLYESVVR